MDSGRGHGREGSHRSQDDRTQAPPGAGAALIWALVWLLAGGVVAQEKPESRPIEFPPLRLWQDVGAASRRSSLPPPGDPEERGRVVQPPHFEAVGQRRELLDAQQAIQEGRPRATWKLVAMGGLIAGTALLILIVGLLRRSR